MSSRAGVGTGGSARSSRGVVLLARKRVGEVGMPRLHAVIFYGEPNVDVVDVLLRLRPSLCLLEYYIQGILSAHLVLLTAVAVGYSRPIPLRDSSRLFWYLFLAPLGITSQRDPAL